MKLRADAVQGGYVLNGTKFWITNAAYADTLVVYAKTAPESGSRGITAFLIEKDFDGFAIGQKIDKLGMRGSPTAELVFTDCHVPDENVMGPLHGGVGVLMSGLDYERVVLSGIQLGIMQACLDCVLPYVRERQQFGKPIGSFQLMQAKIADMYVALNAARSYVYNVAKACDAGQTNAGVDAVIRRVSASTASGAAARTSTPPSMLRFARMIASPPSASRTWRNAARELSATKRRMFMLAVRSSSTFRPACCSLLMLVLPRWRSP